MTRAAVLVALVLAARVAVADPFVDAVVSVTIGDGGGGGGADRVLGPPRGGGAFQGSLDTLSLGLGGSIVVAFTDNVVVDGPGPDFTVFENPFLQFGVTTLAPYAEPGTVSVSADGEHWATFPCAIDDAAHYFPGCAGVYPVFANADDPSAPSPLVPSTAPIASLIGVQVDQFVPPAGSGGDSFDLAQVGLAAIRFVRIDGGMRERRLNGLSGFDLDAIAGVHSRDVAGVPDTDGDGIPDVADDCPATSDPMQLDADGDGVGDACDACPADAAPGTSDGCPGSGQGGGGGGGGGGSGGGDGSADADGDGIPDAADPCPHDAACVPYVAGTFAGGRRRGAAARLLTYATPTARVTPVSSLVATARVVVAIAPEVTPGSVRIRAGGADLTATLGPFVPGSVRTLLVPLGVRRTVVRLRATARHGRRTLVDRDRFVFVRPAASRP